VPTRESVADDPPPRQPTPVPAPSSGAKLQASPRDIAAALKLIEAVVELEKARRAHPERHEAIFNEAILIHEYGQYLAVEDREAALLAAIHLYHLFIQRAESDPDAADAVRIAKERLAQIESVTICNFRETVEDRKRREAEEKQRAAQEEVYRGE